MEDNKIQETISSKLKFLEAEIEERILSFDSKRVLNRKRAFTFKMVTVMCSGAVTILLGIHSAGEPTKIILKDIALLLSVSLTIFSTWDTFFNYRELWTKYTETSNKLKELKSDINYLLVGNEGNVTEENIDKFYYKYKEILKNTNSHWIKAMSKKTSKNTTKQ